MDIYIDEKGKSRKKLMKTIKKNDDKQD